MDDADELVELMITQSPMSAARAEFHVGRYRFGSSEPSLQVFSNAGQAFKGCGEHQHGGEKRHEAANGGGVGLRLHGHIVDNHCGRQRCKQLHDRYVCRRRCGLFHHVASQCVTGVIEARRLVRLPAKNLHDFVAVNRFLYNVGKITHRSLCRAARFAQADIEVTHHECNGRQHT